MIYGNSIYFFIPIVLIIALFLIVLICGINFLVNTKSNSNNFKPISQNNLRYLDKLLELVKIRTTSFETDAEYHLFREKIKEMFPLFHQKFSREKFEGNVIYRYRTHREDAPNILFAAHIDYFQQNQQPIIKNGELYGDGTFDAKSLLYAMLESVEKILDKKNTLPINLTVAITKDDDSTKQGVNGIVDMFLKRGYFFDSVLEEGSGIVDPDFFGLKSHYALIGIGVTGEFTIRFTVPKNGANRLIGFMHILKKKNIFRFKINNKTKGVLKQIAKDMWSWRRFIFSNLWLFQRTVKKIINREFPKIAKMHKTQMEIGEIVETDGYNYFDAVFQLSAHEQAADIICPLGNYLDRYDIEYQIIDVKESARITNVKQQGYKAVKSAIKAVFGDIIIVPTIITNTSEKRNYDKLSDCVIRFSPLYYPYSVF